MHEHRRDQKAEATCALVVTSDTRGPETDETGKMAVKLLEEAGQKVAAYMIIRNNEAEILDTVNGLLENNVVQVVITSGGTGISQKDVTVDAVRTLFDREMDGFGEHFRRLSLEQVGEAAIMSRATAGVAGRKLVFCLPGSKNAMELGLKRIILPALGHMLWEVNR